ncbi:MULTISPECIES: acyl-ACP--UDP-N-acetylglucosamine O-acyltransferase [Microvirgula]|uniref:Acyl-[acyl-carrier-protein]--UDP-N-acetylglucosamine O-acyltransferase n=1 Tax=Microvirgula aerodenitrificans TaxID=57480 RepID=A0A2U3TGZ1_9NEIS|nr:MULTISPECIES: acyl-ACP--UDP-N-acetylglucosamine O-acyltransferase [Microvirgula]AVY92663.1 acyl-ACP--UDP-N-acetylglucosamine O-acyltransferase [Microvirgula aerodenitrificans]RAS17404.1 acyl-[acyl-carrier-protein]--UDP-N-acetylglucosamine O-acyltransferase [Microvirgula sp. AG722]
MSIHPTALIDPAAQIDTDVEIGAYAVIGPHVSVGKGSKIGHHTVVEGHTRIGENNTVFPFASLGQAPQDKKYAGEETRLEIGNGNTIREFCTLNLGTVQDVGVTRVGNDNWIMAYVHIAHDCQVGDHCILANNATLAGHVTLGDWVVLGGLTALHQFCHVGAHAMTAGGSIVVQDIPPYVMAAGNHASPVGINSEGLKRRGYSAEAIKAIRMAYKQLYRNGLSFDDAKAQIAKGSETVTELALFNEFFARTTRGIIR